MILVKSIEFQISENFFRFSNKENLQSLSSYQTSHKLKPETEELITIYFFFIDFIFIQFQSLKTLRPDFLAAITIFTLSFLNTAAFYGDTCDTLFQMTVKVIHLEEKKQPTV